ncbi:MAG: hydrogenase iron-sulfur subunit [Promethearchaeota archaeon]
MEFKIMIISRPECKYNEEIFKNLKQFKKKHLSVEFTRIENIGTLDLKLFFYAICDGFDGIIVITKWDEKEKYMDFRCSLFQKHIAEANKILEKRGFGVNRVNLCYWDGLNYKILIKNFIKAFKKIKKCGKNPINRELLKLQQVTV